jgi:hypothetical protein
MRRTFAYTRNILRRRKGARSTPIAARLVLAAVMLGCWPVFHFTQDRLYLSVLPDWAVSLCAACMACAYFTLLVLLALSLKKRHEISFVGPERDKIAQDIAEAAFRGTLGDQQFVIFLRPFRFDGRRPIRNPELEGNRGLMSSLAQTLLTGVPTTKPQLVDLETLITDMLAPHYDFISVGGITNVVGAGRIAADDWQRVVELLTQAARLIIFVPSDTAGCEWEAQQIISRNLLNKTLFFMPPSEKQTIWNNTRQGWSKHGISLPHYNRSGAMFFIRETGEVFWLYALSKGEHFAEIQRRIISLADNGGLREALDKDTRLAAYIIR